jgi:hypothetical protein
MTFGSNEKEFFEEEFRDCFKWALDKASGYTILICDFMQFTKSKPKSVETRDDLIVHFKEIVNSLMHRTCATLRIVIIVVDGKPVDVKRMIAHVKRYGSKPIMQYEEGNPRLPENGYDLVPQDWITFAGNYELLRRELYPLLFNTFMFNMEPMPGQSLILSGFPGRSGYAQSHIERPWECNVNEGGRVWQVKKWEKEELPITPKMEEEDSDLYHRVYILENVSPSHQFPNGALVRREWEEAKTDISEGDLRILWFEHWFQQENIIFCINDGDIFSLGLLYAQERLLNKGPNGEYHFRNKHTIMLKYIETDKKKKAREARGIHIVPEPYHYINMNLLYQQVSEYPVFVSNGVQSPVATMVFLIIMAETDFFAGFLKGMTAKNVIWKVFFENIVIFTHLIQYSAAVTKSTRDDRTVVIDEDAFRKFIIFCYLQKYEPGMNKQTVTFQELSKRTKTTAKGTKRMKKNPDGTEEEDTAWHMPEKNKVRSWCRQVEWNFMYWANGWRGIHVDPFELWYGMSYYPYRKNTETGKPEFIQMVSPRPKPVDTVFSQHFLKNRLKQMREKEESYEQSMQRKRKALKTLGK